MPIFQSDLPQPRHGASSDDQPPPPLLPPRSFDFRPSSNLRRLSEESLPVELCEGPLPDSPVKQTPPSHSPTVYDARIPLSDRTELIERLKRAQSPTWRENDQTDTTEQDSSKMTAGLGYGRLESLFRDRQNRPAPSPVAQQTTTTPSMSPFSTLMPAPEITPEKGKDERPHSQGFDSRLREGLAIERPRSALHRGDFTQDDAANHKVVDSPRPLQPLSSRYEAEQDWLSNSPPRDFAHFNFERRPRPSDQDFRPPPSVSSSLSSSFAYQPPTSPLVQSESNDDPGLCQSFDGLGQRSQRRHTLYSACSSPFALPSVGLSVPRGSHHRRERSLPYQAHQPRRSLTTTHSFAGLSSTPSTPAYLRSRRQSLGSDSSPLHHASMVGSYEESILRGRMSTNPSKPLDFLAQIGVLGMGNCKPNLRCPAHVTLPFSAVYYSYNSTSHGRSQADDGPSPYVGQIDLENGLPNTTEESRSKHKAQARHSDRALVANDPDTVMREQGAVRERRPSRSTRRSESAKAPPGGSYRIPEKGQIQIIIKNQNKTAVKLFLVPYDLAGMEPGTKTFVRQRSYSAGPIIEGIPSAPARDSPDRGILRYLVHLHICSPAKGRFYLYKSIRVVFANRVPDGKEKLRNDTTWPDPRFTPYKPIRLMHPPAGPGAMLAADKASRRRSAGFSFGVSASSRLFDRTDHRAWTPPNPPSFFRAASTGSASGGALPVEPIPFRFPARGGAESETSDATAEGWSSRPSTTDSQDMEASDSGPDARYAKLHKGDFGYGGNAFAGSAPATEGLLSQRLRTVGLYLPPPSLDDDEDVLAPRSGLPP